MSRPLRVFLCHASQDKPAVRELYNALKSEGWIDPWLDKAKILPGQDWEMVIEKAVDASDVVVICLSSQSVTKEGFVQREIRYTYDLALEKPEDTIFLIPLRLDDCSVPRKLRTIHWVNYFGDQKQETYSDLLEALQLRYDQKLKSEAHEEERERVERQAQQEAEELARKLATEKAAREKAEREVKENTAREERERDAKRKQEAKELARYFANEKATREKAERERETEKKQKTEKLFRPLRVFLCHASQDKSVVRELYQRLSAEDWIDPWMNEEDILLGQHWTTAIEDAINQSDVVLIFLSRNSAKKEGFVQRELNYAWELSLEKPHDVIFLIPLRLCDCEIPRFLNARQWGDYFGDKKEGAYRTLLRSLKKRYEQKMNQEEDDLETRENVALQKAKQEAEEKIKRERIRHEYLKWEVAEQAVENAKRDAARKSKQRILAAVLGVLVLVSLFFVAASWVMNWFKSPQPLSAEVPLATETPVTPAEPPAIDVPTKASTLGIGSTLVSEKDGMVMAYVPAGEFSMGSNTGNSDERPVHRVYLDAFWIDKTEVTNAMYEKCIAGNVCKELTNTNSSNRTSYYGNLEFDNYPVIYVNWDMAKTYCEWRDARLPTEAEWEKAARGTDSRTYPWGEIIDCYKANYASHCSGNTTPVGHYSYGISIYNVYDMAGNVWEWVNDWYGETYYQGSPLRNPVGPDLGSGRVMRGGSWNGDIIHGSRSADRNYGAPDNTFYFVGFRCARLVE